MSISQSSRPEKWVGWMLPGLLSHYWRKPSPTRILRAGQTAMRLAGCMMEQGTMRSISQLSQPIWLEMSRSEGTWGFGAIGAVQIGMQEAIGVCQLSANPPREPLCRRHCYFLHSGHLDCFSTRKVVNCLVEYRQRVRRLLHLNCHPFLECISNT